jgi:pyruvate-formate lyase-activating enzyme
MRLGREAFSSSRPMVDATLAHAPQHAAPRSRFWDTLRLVASSGGPGRCEFALNNACNANCGFCNFARDTLPKERWEYVERQGAFDAIDILFRQGIRYLVLTGGEPTLHPDLTAIIARAARAGMKVMLVSNGGLFKARRIGEYAAAGVSSFVISIDAADAQRHEDNRGLPGVCDKIRDANREITRRGLTSTASVTLSRLVDIDALPAFLADLGFKAVTFSYPLTNLNSSFLGYRDSGVVDFTPQELHCVVRQGQGAQIAHSRRQSDALAGGDAAVSAQRAAEFSLPRRLPLFLPGLEIAALALPFLGTAAVLDLRFRRGEARARRLHPLHDRLLPRRLYDAAHRGLGSRHGAIVALGRSCRRGQGARSQGQCRIDPRGRRRIAVADAILTYLFPPP